MEDKDFINLIVDVFEKQKGLDVTMEYCRPDEGIHHHTSSAYLAVAKASYEAGKAEGIKTVVEWVKSHSEIDKCDPSRWIDEAEWQSFLKEHWDSFWKGQGF